MHLFGGEKGGCFFVVKDAVYKNIGFFVVRCELGFIQTALGIKFGFVKLSVVRSLHVGVGFELRKDGCLGVLGQKIVVFYFIYAHIRQNFHHAIGNSSVTRKDNIEGWQLHFSVKISSVGVMQKGVHAGNIERFCFHSVAHDAIVRAHHARKFAESDEPCALFVGQ